MNKLYTYEWLERNGRLGNQLWQIGTTIARSQEDPGSYASIKADWEYRPYFSVPDYYYTQWDGSQFEVVDGGTEYFQELRHFGNQAGYIRQILFPSELAFQDMVAHEAYDDFMYYHMVGHPKCSLHVRRGDYLKYPDHFPIPTPEYYQRAIDKVLEEDDQTVFFVFSDDIEWCKDNFGSDRMHYVTGITRPVEVVDRIAAGPPKDYMDLVAMVLCERHIIANSTFSWWGAWLSGDQRVIYPSKWFGNHPFVRNIPWREMIPPTWQEVEV